MNARELKKRTLIGMHRMTIKVGFGNQILLGGVKLLALPWQAGQLDMILKSLAESGWIEVERFLGGDFSNSNAAVIPRPPKAEPGIQGTGLDQTI